MSSRCLFCTFSFSKNVYQGLKLSTTLNRCLHVHLYKCMTLCIAYSVLENIIKWNFQKLQDEYQHFSFLLHGSLNLTLPYAFYDMHTNPPRMVQQYWTIFCSLNSAGNFTPVFFMHPIPSVWNVFLHSFFSVNSYLSLKIQFKYHFLLVPASLPNIIHFIGIIML